MSFNSITYQVEDGIARIHLNQPQRLNSLTIELQTELRQALAQVRDDRSVRAVLLAANGRAWCVGAALDTVDTSGGSSSPAGGGANMMANLSNPLMLEFYNLPVPVVAAVNGPAAGAGISLALVADIVVAAKSSYFYMPFIPKLGIVPDLGATWFVQRLLGRARATELTLLGDRLPAEKALEWGLIARCVEDASLLDEALAIARRLAKLPSHGAIETRKALAAAENNDLATQLDYEVERQRELLARDSFSEGVKAFFEKREANFSGR